MASLYRLQIEEWLKERQFSADQVLDVGGGDKKASSITKIECNNYIVMDSDAGFNPGIIHDLNEFGHPDDIFSIYQNPRFDLIFCLNVFEYIYNPYNAIANLYTWLAPGGTLVMNVPFLYPVHNPVGIDYLRYTHEWVQKMLHERFKFSEVETTPIIATQGADALRAFYSVEKMHTRKGDASWIEIGTIIKAVK
jgi:SAM-dependent methyltransferase